MIRNLFFTLCIFSLLATTTNAQCNECENSENSFCYTNEKFAEYCAYFNTSNTSLKLYKAKKGRLISIPEKTDMESLLKIANNKKLKIKASEILFIREALLAWEIESRKLGYTYTDSGLGIKILKEGDGDLPEKGKNVTVHYSGFLENGKKFDSSYDRDEPFSFPLGAGRVIKGWDEGVAALKIGSKALLKIPAELGYGERGAGGVIPPNATLYFEIEVLGQ